MKLSVITINYNNAIGLRKTIESVVNQTFRDYEYIIIDGGSTDGSVDVIKEYADKIDYWVSEPDKGIYNAMNKGVAAAHGEYTNFLNSGDSYYSNFILSEIFNKEYEEDILSGNVHTDKGNVYSSPEEVTMEFFYNGTLPHPASFIRKNLFEDNLYDETLKIIGDWKFFLIALIRDNASYRKLDKTIVVFDTTGISLNDFQINRKEKEFSILSTLLPKRVLDDYEIFTGKRDDFHRLFYVVSHSRLKKLVYRSVLLFLKVIYLNRGWINRFSVVKCRIS
jgi:glycosyltransferase involved in cell wall biosynthesis